MVKCPFCGFGNEDGALFCEQCKSDISNVTPAPTPAAMPETIPMAESPVMAAIVDDDVIAAVPVEEPIVAEPMPVEPDATLPGGVMGPPVEPEIPAATPVES